jgi:hypothetical protein
MSGGMSALKRAGGLCNLTRVAQLKIGSGHWALGRHFRMVFAVEDAKIRITKAEFRV